MGIILHKKAGHKMSGLMKESYIKGYLVSANQPFVLNIQSSTANGAS